MIVHSSILDLKLIKIMKTKADIDESKALLLTKESVRKLKH